jgi:predicted porin
MYTQYIQANYSGITSNDECLAKGKATCGGYESFASIAADYKFNKRFDIYGGVAYTRIFSGMYENQSGGGFQHNNAISPTVGARFQF